MVYISSILCFAGAILSGAVGLTILLRENRTAANWAFIAGMLAFAAEAVFDGLSLLAPLPDSMIFWQKLSILAVSILPGAWLLFSLTFSRGNYRQFVAKWRWGIAGALAIPLLVAVVTPLDHLIRTYQLLPYGDWYLSLGWPGELLQILVMVGSVLVLMNLERTFQAAVGTMRWRIKFMILGLGLLFVARFYTCSQTVLFSSYSLSLKGVSAGALILACGLIAVSMLRTKSINLDLYPSLSVLHRSLIALLAGIYLLIVGVFAKVVSVLGGDEAFPIKAFLVLVALVCCTVLLLSDRIQQHTKRFISRQFKRSFYDYREVWRTFTERTTSMMDATELCRAITKWISETFHALSVTIWLADTENRRLAFAASTSLTESSAQEWAGSPAEIQRLIEALSSQNFPLDIARTKNTPFEMLNRLNPDIYGKGGSHVCVPLIARGKLLGLMTLWDRVSGLTYTFDDLDLLKCIGDQVASNLLNIQLSQSLLQAREMEAFQAMSAFFVHDLKNTASTLSLMLQNLPQHFEDPQFREDALRAVGRSVNHLNDLISRLNRLRQELKMNPVASDVNEVINAAVAGLDDTMGIALSKSLQALPKISIDPVQIQSVITNLVLNAREATPVGGAIRVDSARQDEWVVITVADNGSGMSAEFVRRSLFRPFQTTKKKGLGIGMFHSKMIVDAHHGKILVESVPGQGTTFRVCLPVKIN